MTNACTACQTIKKEELNKMHPDFFRPRPEFGHNGHGNRPREWTDIVRSSAVAGLVSIFLFCLAARSAGQDNVSGRVPQLPGVGIDPRLSDQIPLDLKFRDETGQTVTLGSYFGKKPVILSLIYFHCQMVCPLVEHGMVTALRDVDFNIGEQYQVLTVSIDPTDTPELAMGQKVLYTGLYGRPGAKQGWHFLVGDQPSIRALARAVGFQYKYMAEMDKVAHAARIVVLTPNGNVSCVFHGIQYPAQEIRVALAEASIGKMANPLDSDQMRPKGNSGGGSPPPGDGLVRTP
jgi:protein SCO1